MAAPKISVIIPAYNEEKYINQCLSSLFKQTKRPLEIIVVDDGSTDRTSEILKELSAGNPQLVTLKQRHCGPAKARNLGAKKARGNILVFPDADMRFDKNYLKKLVKPITEEKAVATFTKEEYVANPQNFWSQCWSINSNLPLRRRIPETMADKAWTFRAIKKKVFLETGGYFPRGYDDDKSVIEKIGRPIAVAALGAICYHYNPSTPTEVFYSARWIGKGKWFEKNRLKWFLIFSPLNSLRNGVIKSIKYCKPGFVLFKLVFDFGAALGLLEKKLLKIDFK